jgi:hypothetical protein
MRKILIAIGVILSFLVVTNIQCLAEVVKYGCLDKEDKFRIVEDPKKCKEGERVIFWNKIMPAVDPGGLVTMPSVPDTPTVEGIPPLKKEPGVSVKWPASKDK